MVRRTNTITGVYIPGTTALPHGMSAPSHQVLLSVMYIVER